MHTTKVNANYLIVQGKVIQYYQLIEKMRLVLQNSGIINESQLFWSRVQYLTKIKGKQVMFIKPIYIINTVSFMEQNGINFAKFEVK